MKLSEVMLGEEKRKLVLSGDFDAMAINSSDCRDQLDSIADAAMGDVYIDLSQVGFLDSSGIGAMVFLYKRLNSNGLSLEIINPVGQPRQLLEMLRIHEAIPVRMVA